MLRGPASTQTLGELSSHPPRQPDTATAGANTAPQARAPRWASPQELRIARCAAASSPAGLLYRLPSQAFGAIVSRDVTKPSVSLDDVLLALESASEEFRSYIDPETGAVVTISDEERHLVEADEPLTDLPEWQRDIVAHLRTLDLDRLLPLPDRFDIHEWAIMQDFAASQTEDHPAALLDAVHGSGAFRMFRRELDQFGLRDAW